MYIDKELEFCDAQAITGDAASDGVVDTTVSCSRAYNEMWLDVRVQTTFDSAGDAGTLNVKLQTDDDEAFGTATDLYATGAIAQTALVAGASLIKMRLSGFSIKRYLRLYFDNGTEVFTAGKVDAFLTPDEDFGH